METILENKYVVMYLDRNQELIHDVWNESSGDMTAEEFKNILIEWRELVIEYQLKKALVDTRNMRFMVAPKLQKWAAKNINKPVQDKGFRKIATLLPATIFEKVALEQTMAEYHTANNFQTQVFDDEELARAWLDV